MKPSHGCSVSTVTDSAGWDDVMNVLMCKKPVLIRILMRINTNVLFLGCISHHDAAYQMKTSLFVLGLRHYLSL